MQLQRNSRAPRPGIGVLLAALLAWAAGAGVAGADDTVPPPFLPVRVEAASAGGATEVSVWGRRYRFTSGPIPIQIESQGVALFRRPAKIDLRAGGDANDVVWEPTSVVRADAASAVLRSRAPVAGGVLEAETTVEYDGMIRVDLRLRADRRLAVQDITYELFLSAEVARFYSHHVEYDYQRRNVDKDRLVAAAGAFPNRTQRFRFAPSMFVGNREVGVEWWSETNAHWTGRLATRPIELTAESAGAGLRVQPVSGGLVLGPGDAWSDTFAIFPVPLRPAPRDHRSIRFLSPPLSRRFDDSIGTRFVWTAPAVSVRARWHGLPESADGDYNAEQRATLRKMRVVYLPYAKLTLAPSFHPVAMARLGDWSTDGKGWRNPQGEEAAILELNGHQLAPDQPYSYAVCMGREDYVDWVLGENLRIFHAEQLEGIYFDHGGITRMCLDSPVIAGRRGREVWEYSNVRSFYKRLYTAMKASNPESLLVIHTHGQPKALAAFADYMMIGESLNRFFSDGNHFGEVLENPRLYNPDYFRVLDHLQAQMFPPVGGTAVLLPQIKYGVVSEDPERGRAFQRGFYAIALVNDWQTMSGIGEFEVIESVLQALDRFGGFEGARVHPWWSNGNGVRADGLRVTLYTRGARALVVASNWSTSPVETTIELDRAKLGIASAKHFRDLESERVPRKRLSGAAIPVVVPARDFRLLLVE